MYFVEERREKNANGVTDSDLDLVVRMQYFFLGFVECILFLCQPYGDNYSF